MQEPSAKGGIHASASGASLACGVGASPARAPLRASAVAPLVAAERLSRAVRGGTVSDLGVVFREYRRVSGLTQQQLADALSFDRTYISMIEQAACACTDRRTLAHVAQALGISPHVLGITDAADEDFATMVEFGASVIRLADVARHTGMFDVAISECLRLLASPAPGEVR